jgi:hypothetical protein
VFDILLGFCMHHIHMHGGCYTDVQTWSTCALCSAPEQDSDHALLVSQLCRHVHGAHSGAACVGTSPFVLHQGMSFGDIDLPSGSSEQPSIEACAEGCLKYKGASPCVAWTYSSPEDGTPGICQLKAAVVAVHLTDQHVVSGHMTGKAHPPLREVRTFSAQHAARVPLSPGCVYVCASGAGPQIQPRV